MNVTVILCTYNRCQQLRKALESAAEISVGDGW
jgi:glycosyltransferase involved in cell wall biosynthesis